MALLLSAFVAVMAQQGTPQTDQKKQAANADAKEACCCSNGGCDMKAEGGSDTAKAANGDAKHACCGDSCDMMAKHDPAKHDAAKGDMAKHDKKSHAEGSCCNAKHKDAKNKEKQPGN
jgi:hypothetical protein